MDGWMDGYVYREHGKGRHCSGQWPGPHGPGTVCMHTQINDTSHLDRYRMRAHMLHTYVSTACMTCLYDEWCACMHECICTICISQMSMLSNAAQARTHTRARRGCTCPVFIEAPVFQQERAAAHHQCHHQCSRSPDPDQLTPHPNLQPSTSTLHFKPLCSGAIHRRAHPRRVVARCARGCGYVSTIICSRRPTTCSRRPTNLAFVGCTTRFLADLFASVRDLTCHHAPHAFL